MRKHVIAVVFCLLFATFVFVGCSELDTPVQSGKTGAFTCWKDGASSLRSIKEYVAAVTDKSSPDYIPEEDRIAVSDFDGTLFGENDPLCFEWMMFAYRVLDDTEYSKKATGRQIEVAKSVQQAAETGVIPEKLYLDQEECYTQAFSGLTAKEYGDYVVNYLSSTDSTSFCGLKIIDEFYLPMLEVIEYLKNNGFQVYVCTGSDSVGVRALACGVLGIPEQNVIGSDVLYKAPDQSSSDVQYNQIFSGDQLVRTDTLLCLNVGSNKTLNIENQIGKKPVLCIGNSSGDESMATYVSENNIYKSLVLMILCDDTVREHGDLAKAEKQKASWEFKGWSTVSMANDWSTIYGESAVLLR